jgi:hypothetical protein
LNFKNFTSSFTMAPYELPRAVFADFVAANPDFSAPHHALASRSLKVNSAQKVTLGIIAVYVVVIALLWNLPVIRWSLWPFKVSRDTNVSAQLEICN